jgi:hypothetical protein
VLVLLTVAADAGDCVANTSAAATTATIAAIPTGRKDALALEDAFRYLPIVVTYRTGVPDQG